MQVTVSRVPRPNVPQTLELGPTATVADIVGLIGAHPDQVIVIRDESPVPLDAPVADKDVLRVVNVFSGG